MASPILELLGNPLMSKAVFHQLARPLAGEFAVSEGGAQIDNLLAKWDGNTPLRRLLKSEPGLLCQTALNALALSEVYFRNWLKQQNLEAQVLPQFKSLQPLLARSLYAPLQGSGSQANHQPTNAQSLPAVLDLIDCVGNYLALWYEGLGSRGASDLEVLNKSLQPLFGTSLCSAKVRAAQTEVQRLVTSREKRLKNLNQRLRSMVEGKLAAATSRQQCVKLLHETVAGRKLPQNTAAFLQGPWFQSLNYIYLTEGEKSSTWKRAVDLTDAIVGAVFPETDSKPTRFIAMLCDELPDFIFSLQHDEPAKLSWLALLESDHKAVMKTQSLAYDSRLDLVDTGINETLNARVSETLIRKAKRCMEGDWFRFAGECTARAQILCIADGGRRYIFSNVNGQKVLEISLDEFAYLLANGSAKSISQEFCGHTLLVNIVEQTINAYERSHVARQTEHTAALKALEAAREKAQREAERLAKLQAESESRYSEEIRRKEQEFIRLKEEKTQLETEKRRLEIEKRINNLQLGEAIFQKRGSEVEKLLLAVRFSSSDKLLFTSELGIKRLEIKSQELIQQILNDDIYFATEEPSLSPDVVALHARRFNKRRTP